jgi:soluble lytic murein transglycosylase
MALWAGLAGAASHDPFLDAQEAFRKGDAKTVDKLAPRLKGHPLASYVEYYQLRMRIDVADPAEITSFIERHDNECIGDAMRADRLRWLARKERWDDFEAGWPKVTQPDVELKCLSLEARRKRPDPLLAEAALQIWSNERDLPDACEDFFRSAFAMKVLPERAIWQRARRHLEAGRTAIARQSLAYLPTSSQLDNKTWQSITKRPAEFLSHLGEGKALPPHRIEHAALAVLALARTEPEDAAAQLRRIGQRLPETERGALWGAVATQAAMVHHPKAAEWFDAAKEAVLTDEQHRWRARAALRVGDFARLRAAIEVMPGPVAEEPAWIYWQARALAAAGKQEAAQVAYGRIANQPNFYGILATEELGRRIVLPPTAKPPTTEEIARVEASGAVRRALALAKLDLRTEAVREWNWALAGMDDRGLLAAAAYAARHGVFDRAISAADRTRTEHDYGLRYLTPYDDAIRPAAKKAQLDEAWVYGLMRQESRFINVARSSAGAQGLMQLMPATARWVARKLGLADYHPSKVTDIGMNVTLGTTYLRLVYESLDQSPVLASAAYNAGPGRARRWRDPTRPLEGAIYAETIPFTETRDYVKKVLANAVIYSAILGGKPDSLKARLGIIRPDTGSPPANEELP